MSTGFTVRNSNTPVVEIQSGVTVISSEEKPKTLKEISNKGGVLLRLNQLGQTLAFNIRRLSVGEVKNVSELKKIQNGGEISNEDYLKSLKLFKTKLGQINFVNKLKTVTYGNQEATKTIGYVARLQSYVSDAIKAYEYDQVPIEHTLNHVVSETLSYVYEKLTNHTQDKGSWDHEDIAKAVINALIGDPEIGKYISESPYKSLLVKQGGDPYTAKDIVQDIKSQIKQNRSTDTASLSIKEITEPVGEASNTIEEENEKLNKVYLKALEHGVNSKKPKYQNLSNGAALEGSEKRIDHHLHPFNGYDKRTVELALSSLLWEVGREGGGYKKMAMAIPHEIVSILCELCKNNFLYYTDPCVTGVKASNDVNNTVTLDAQLIKALRANKEKLQNIIPTITDFPGIPEETNQNDEERIKKFINGAGKYAEERAKEIAEFQLNAGSQNILVTFGELTINKSVLPQALLSAFAKDMKEFETYAKDFLVAIYKGAQAGVNDAIEKSKKAGVNDAIKESKKAEVQTQIRIVLHMDTEEVAGKDNKTEDGNNVLRKVNVGCKEYEIPQPNIKNLVKILKCVDKALEKADGFELVLQHAHMFGETYGEFENKAAWKTGKMYELLKDPDLFKTIRLIADTSWLPVAARYINQGTGAFLMNEGIEEIGQMIIDADNISNEAFMFFNTAERHFQNQMLENKNAGGQEEKKEK